MMTKQRSGTFSGWKATIALPALLGLVIVFSTSFTLTVGNQDQQTSQIIHSVGKPMPLEPRPVISPLEDTVVKVASGEPVYDVVKTMPEFKGGFNAMVQFLLSNIKYPDEAKQNNISGTVFVSFIVEKNGKIRNVSVLKGVDPLLDAEALRVVSMMPDWTPGYDDNGKAVNVKFNLPIKFNLDGDKAKTEEKK